MSRHKSLIHDIITIITKYKCGLFNIQHLACSIIIIIIGFSGPFGLICAQFNPFWTGFDWWADQRGHN